jgi:hypothetical protein
MTEPKKIFISYNHKDHDQATNVLHHLQQLSPEYEIWFDRHNIALGEHLSDKIVDGLKGSDYYLVLLSENSSKSDWVKREISLAFELSKSKQLALVPMLIDDTEVPLEFKGLLYVDARRSFQDGLNRLVDFFSSQIKPVFALDPGRYFNQKTCEPQLSGLELGDLRFLLTKRLTIENIKVIWFDIFNVRMEDEVNIQSLAQCCVELIDRSRREELLQKLVMAVCRNHPRLGDLAKA